MEIPYFKTSFNLRFESPIQWKVIPTFFLRSLMGSQLKRICCIQRQSICDQCILKETCGYAVLFESPLAQDNLVLEGRNRGYHPFVLSHGAIMDNNTKYQFILTLIGKGTQYFPFIVYAFQQAGAEGIFSSKIHYEITSITDATTGHLVSGKSLKMPDIQTFHYDNDEAIAAEKAVVVFKTPARIKHRGRYTLEFDSFSLFTGLYRRLKALSLLYVIPNNSDYEKLTREYTFDPSLRISSRDLFWKDFFRFSHRQDTAMELGGVLGSLDIDGPLRKQDISLLEGGRIFHIGKNTGFGLGEMDYHLI